MKQTEQEKGLAHLGVIVTTILVVAAIVFAGWWVWSKNKADTTTTHTEQTQESKTSDPSEGGKYLVIEEWGVRFELPEEFVGYATYSLGKVTSDPDGNQIQSAALLVRKDSVAENDCAPIEISGDTFTDAATQVLRTEKNKTFDETRYKGSFQKTILADDIYAYHLNYTAPVCVGLSGIEQVKQLQNALFMLQKIN